MRRKRTLRRLRDSDAHVLPGRTSQMLGVERTVCIVTALSVDPQGAARLLEPLQSRLAVRGRQTI